MIWKSIEYRVKAVLHIGSFVVAAADAPFSFDGCETRLFLVYSQYFRCFSFFFFWCADFMCACLPFAFSLRYIFWVPHIWQRKICEFIVHVAMAKTKRTFVLFICSLCERYLHRFRYDVMRIEGERKKKWKYDFAEKSISSVRIKLRIFGKRILSIFLFTRTSVS